MRTESPGYRAERIKWTTKPTVVVRCSYVRTTGDATEYPFAQDFTSRVVLSPTRPKLRCIKTVSGVAQQADPIAGRSSIGFLEVQLQQDNPTTTNQVLRQLSDPARPLKAPPPVTADGAPTSRNATHILATPGMEDDWTLKASRPTCRNSTHIGATAAATEFVWLAVDDISVYPDAGHVTIDEEDFSYASRDLVNNVFVHVRGGARGSTPANHVVDTPVHNGEQLRRGTRATLILGYAPLPEAEFGPGPGFTKMEVQSVASLDHNMTWSVRCSDIQRFTKRRIFEKATTVNPAALGPDHPITLFLRAWTSTGLGTNSAYDILPADMGAAVPSTLIDIAAFEQIRTALPGFSMTFSETTPQDAKEWGEAQILRPLGILPYINQSGQYSGRLIAVPSFAGEGAWSNIERAVA